MCARERGANVAVLDVHGAHAEAVAGEIRSEAAGGRALALECDVADDSAVGAAITTIASTAAIRGHGFGAGYTASKGGVAAFTRLIAVQCGPRRRTRELRVPRWRRHADDRRRFASDQSKAQAKRSIPLGRYAEADDIAQVAAWLLGDGARYVTGQTFPVEGGATIA